MTSCNFTSILPLRTCLTILLFCKTRNVSSDAVAHQCQPLSIFLHGDYESVSPAQIVMVLVIMLVMGVASSKSWLSWDLPKICSKSVCKPAMYWINGPSNVACLAMPNGKQQQQQQQQQQQPLIFIIITIIIIIIIIMIIQSFVESPGFQPPASLGGSSKKPPSGERMPSCWGSVFTMALMLMKWIEGSYD